MCNVVAHMAECGYRSRDQIEGERESRERGVSEYQVGSQERKDRTHNEDKITAIGLGGRSSRSSCLRGRFYITKRLGNNDVVRDTRENESIVLLDYDDEDDDGDEGDAERGDGFNPTATTGLTGRPYAGHGINESEGTVRMESEF